MEVTIWAVRCGAFDEKHSYGLKTTIRAGTTRYLKGNFIYPR
jgi:hypothetical protein